MDIICARCGTVNDYYTEVSSPHLKAVCNNCGIYIKFLPQNRPVKLYFGKYKGRTVVSMISEDEIKYLQWAYLNLQQLTSQQKGAIKEHLTRLNREI